MSALSVESAARRVAVAAARLVLLGLSVSFAAAATPAEIRLRPSGAGNYLIDARGYSLYTYAQDIKPGQSACNGECAKAWPPLLAPAGAAAAGEWSLAERDDGTRQWAWRGQPLYRFAKDDRAGALLGDGVGNAWRAALQRIDLPPGFAVRSTHLGRVLTDAFGLTLYWRDDEWRAGKPTPEAACRGGCLRAWKPLTAPWLARARGDWSLLAREDGQPQWAFRGRRLYRHGEDLKPGDTEGLGDGSPWQAAVLDPAPPLPDWVTIQRSDMGEVYADARGHTLYVFSGQLERTRALLCNDECIRRHWRTLPASAGAVPSGEFSVVSDPMGGAGKVWAFKGSALYTHTRDREPGAIGGDKWAAGVGGGGGGWGPVLRRRDREE